MGGGCCEAYSGGRQWIGVPATKVIPADPCIVPNVEHKFRRAFLITVVD